MQELKQHEVEVVAGGDLEGAIWGLGEGLATGAAIGGSISAGSGWGFGLIGQLVGFIVGPIVGAIFGFVGGALTNKETMAAVGAHYRESMGWNSTGGGASPLSFLGDMFGSNVFGPSNNNGPR